METEEKWRTRSSVTHFSDDHLSVSTERVSTPACEEAREWTVVRRKSAVVIAAMTEQDKFILIRQERIPIRQTIWELPAGQVDQLCGSGSFKDVALRELREETGYELVPGAEITFLGDYFCSPGFTDEREFLFLLRPVRRAPAGPAHTQAESIVECREFSADEITRLIADGVIRDANTLSTWARLLARKVIRVS